MKRHAFFKSLDWKKLYNKEIAPPLMLRMEDESESEEMVYLKQMEKVRFKDHDYNDKNKTLNRVKQFTFVRNQV